MIHWNESSSHSRLAPSRVVLIIEFQWTDRHEPWSEEQQMTSQVASHSAILATIMC